MREGRGQGEMRMKWILDRMNKRMGLNAGSETREGERLLEGDERGYRRLVREIYMPSVEISRD